MKQLKLMFLHTQHLGMSFPKAAQNLQKFKRKKNYYSHF